VVAFIAAVGAYKFFQIKKAIAQGSSYQPPPEAVTTVVASSQEWNATLQAIGTVTAVNGVTVSADLPGVVGRITFDSGRLVRKGDVLVELDAKQERAQLASAEAQLNLDRVNLGRQKEMLAAKIVPQAMYDTAAAQFKQSDAKAAELRATIARKIIRAPFDGVLGIREVNLGQTLAGGTPIVSLQSLRPAYVNFSVPQQEIGRLAIGSSVEVTTDAGVVETGRVTAFDAVIDEATRLADDRVRTPEGGDVARRRRFGWVTPQVGRVAVEPPEVPLVDRLDVVAHRPVVAVGVPRRIERRRQFHHLGDLDPGVALVQLTQRLIVQIGVQISL